MAESTKSVAELKQSISQNFQEVNETVTNTAKDLSILTKGIIQKESNTAQLIKEQAVQDLKNVKQQYAEKEEKVLQLLKPGKGTTSSDITSDVAKEYERILQENISKLKEIAQEDFKTSNENNQKLIDETKNKLHNLIFNVFKDHDIKNDFSATAGAIFASVNDKIRDDLLTKSHKAGKTTSNLSPDYTNVFVYSMNKPPEEIEAERLLQQLFEKEILEFNEQMKKDFQDINGQMSRLVDDTKTKFSETLQSVTPKEIPQINSFEVTDTKSLPNLPTKSTVEHNVNNFLNNAGNDIQAVRAGMLSDVEKKKQKINDSAKYYAEKVLGKEFLGSETEED